MQSNGIENPWDVVPLNHLFKSEVSPFRMQRVWVFQL